MSFVLSGSPVIRRAKAIAVDSCTVLCRFSGARFLRSWEAEANSNVGSQLIVTVKVLVHHAARSLFGMFANLPGSIYPKQTNFTTNLSSDELEQERQSMGLLIW